jgi:hypothetical protein
MTMRITMMSFFGGTRHRDASPLVPLVLPQHADQHRPRRPVLLAVDQELEPTTPPSD